ncbi:MAG: aminotransferase class IV [Pseudomonadota bacterium]
MTDFSKGAAFVYGELVPIDDAHISILDWGFLHSDATYDVVHVWNGSFFRLDDHIERFFSGMGALRMEIPYSRSQVVEALCSCVVASGLRNAYVEMICTRGRPQPGSRDPRSCKNQFFAFAIPFVWVAQPGDGLHLVISTRQRIPPESVDPRVKNYHWLDLVMGQFEAFERGGETPAVVDAQGHLTEGPGFNLFAVKDAVLTTPAVGVLEGITRKSTMEIAARLGLAVVEGDLSQELALTADELFATSTAGGIMPITQIDARVVGSGAMGPVTQQVYDAYWAMHSDPHFTRPIDYG